MTGRIIIKVIDAPLPPGYDLRLATKDDLSILPEIEDAAGQLFGPYDAGEANDMNVTADLRLTTGAADAGRLWVVTHGEKVCGFALAMVVDGEAHLHELDVLPEYGRQGLGRALIATLERWATERALPAITLSTRQDVPFNGPFYARLGFIPVPDAQLTPGLRQIRAEEARRGLDVGRRAAMRLVLSR